MEISYNDIFKNQNKRLIPESAKRAIISKVNIIQRQADIQLVNNPETVIKNVAVSNAVDITSLAVGDRVKIDIFDEGNTKDMVIAYSYSGKPVSGENATITYVSNVVLNNLGGGSYSITVTTKTMTFTGGKLTAHT